MAWCSVSRSCNEAVVLHTHYLFELLTQNWRLKEWHVASSASIFQAQEFSHTSSCRLGNSLLNYRRWRSTSLHTLNFFNEYFESSWLGLNWLIYEKAEQLKSHKNYRALTPFCENPWKQKAREQQDNCSPLEVILTDIRADWFSSYFHEQVWRGFSLK